jgi:hypothetical protein
MGFNVGFENFEMLAHAAFVHAAQFPINPVEIRKNDQPHSES